MVLFAARVFLPAAIVVVAALVPASEPSRAQSARAPRAISRPCAPAMSFPVRSAGGSLVWRACDGSFAARFDYGANSARDAAVDQTRSMDPAGFPAIAGTVPVAALELAGISAAPSVAYAAPNPDRSLIASPRILRGSAYELVGYQRDARGAVRIVYQSAVYSAVAPHLLAVVSPLAGVHMQRAFDTTFVLLTLPAGTGPPVSLSTSKGEPNVNLYVSDAKNGVSNGTVDEILAGGSSQKVLGTAFKDPAGIAVDGAGNVYVAEKVSGTVAEIPAAGGPAISLATTTVEPTSVAVDGAGNVFVADGGTVQEIPAGGGTPVTVASGFSGPTGIALDAAGNLYVADTFHNAVKKVAAGSGTAVTLASGFSLPMGVAVDGAGHVYVTDAGNKAVKEIEGSSVITLASAIAGLGQVALDTAGNVYVTASVSGANGVFEIAHGGHVPVAIGSGFTAPAGVAVEPAAAPALRLAKTDNGPWRPGINATPPKYTIAVGNAGTAATTGTITVTDTLPAGLTLTAKPSAQSGASWTCTGAAGATSFTCTSTTPLAARAGAKPTSAVPIVVPITVGAATKLGPKSITNTAHAFGGGDPVHATSSSALSAADSTTVELEPDVNLYVSADSTGQTLYEILAGGSSQKVLGMPGFDGDAAGGVAVDGAGNVYSSYYDASVGEGSVTEIPRGGSPITLGQFRFPFDVAVDGAGNVYVADLPDSGSVQKIPAGGGTPVTIASGFGTGLGIALDAAGNLYVADTMNGKVFRLPAGGGPAVQLGAGFLQPAGVAVDGAGNVYVTDSGHNAVKEIEGSRVIILASGLSGLSQIAVDAAGNVYVGRNSTNGVFEIPAGSSVAVSLGSGLFNAAGVAVKPTATPALTLAKTDNGPWRPGTNATPPKYTITVGNAGTAATTGTITVSDTLPAGLTLSGTPSALSGSSWTCTGAVGATSFTCTSSSPLNARNGAKPSSAAPIVVPVAVGATTKLGIQSITNTAHAFGGGDPLHATSGSALSAADSTTVELQPDVNLYVSDEGGGSVDEILAGGGSQPTLGSGFSDVRGIAVDGTGDVYLAEVGNNTVAEIPAAGGSPITLGTTFSEPTSVAVDGAGDVYVSNFNGGTIQKIPAGGGAPVPFASGFAGPNGIALDAAGNLYVADTFNNRVVRIPAGGGPAVKLGSGFLQPNGVAVDGAGNVYVTDSGRGEVKEIEGGNIVRLAAHFTALQQIAVDTAGNVYVADTQKGAFEIPAGSHVPVAVGSGFNTPWGVAVKPAATPALTLAKTDNGPWRPGANATPPAYTITVGNAGTAATTGTITVNDTLPAGLTLTGTPHAQSGSSWTCTGAAGATSFKCTSTAPLAARTGSNPSAAVPIVVPVTVGATTKLGPKSITNTAHAFGGGDPLHTTSSNALSASDSTTVELQPDFNLYVSDELAGVVDDIQPGGNSSSTLASGLNDVRGIALSHGHVYVAEVGSNTVAKIPVAGGSPIILGTSFSEPTSVAVDAAGDVFVANFNGGNVQEIVGGTGSPVTFASGFAGPNGIALDSAGNLYVADTFHGRVVRIPKGGGTAVKIGAGFLQPNGVAVDTKGNVYVTDTGHSAVKEVEGLAIVTLATGFSNLQQIAVDTDGNVYVADSQRGVFEIPAGSHVPIPLGSGFAAPWGVAVQMPN